jgi:indolepyruvate ferredoxin oxidoreductase beta subunit
MGNTICDMRKERSVNLEIVCAGIGGRGVLLASTIIIETAVRAGYHAMASDEYGMSQRGGSVVSLVKIGASRSPLIGRENADILLAFEESEFYRNLAFLKKGGIAIINTPKDGLPEEINNLLLERNIRCFFIAADAIAKDKSMVQASNMALLGFFSCLRIGPYTRESVLETLKERTKGKFLEKNVDVFQAGYTLAHSSKLSADGRSM